MHVDVPVPTPAPADGRPWYKTLTRYHWFVLTVAALGWLFDTMDQQLFNLARVPAMRELVVSPGDEPSIARSKVNEYAGYTTTIFLIGWATGGIAFGVMGDRIGRARTMLFTILIYSLFTGLSALSTGFWDFALWRFLTGLGVGGEFAVGVSLVAEVMPDKARPFALGLLQALSAVGNITAAVISIVLGHLEETGAIGSAWRIMFVIGTLPALLAILIRRRLKEPERWQAAKAEGKVTHQLGSYRELFGDPRWRHRAIVGLVLASSGVIGLWAIGFFSFDLTRSVFRKNFEQEARKQGDAAKDLAFVRMMIDEVGKGQPTQETQEILKKVSADDLLNFEVKSKDVQLLYKAMHALLKDKKDINPTAVIEQVATQEAQQGMSGQDLAALKKRLSEFFSAPLSTDQTLAEHAARIQARTRAMSGRLTLWAGITSVMLNLGAALGIYFFSRITHHIGRKPAFAISFVLALLSTAMVFWFLDGLGDVFWMIPIMGFCQLSLFGGYAIYFPELFPTRLRSTGISFCYNVGRYVAAIGPSMLGLLTSKVFTEQAGYAEPMRYAGLVMCSVFLIGLVALPFAPETKGKPLPE